MTSPERWCEKGHAMTIKSRFRFDHEPGDSAHDALMLEKFSAMGIELGAEVTLWYCATCDFAQADFTYPDRA
jgi:hypothetical protein